ncbi:hypothetical protein UCRPC4_g01435 [Phaeomoniella chlamydospora]|uniref:Uncharacterized protein n=1 Tax=Phaeomoniella chlamydospora TaxID=158046 RepID=A0A0G2EX29_PHACM|nr:hypothetical protein UCRPC4_g01435 [Phaeomoniella chlamydospora]
MAQQGVPQSLEDLSSRLTLIFDDLKAKASYLIDNHTTLLMVLLFLSLVVIQSLRAFRNLKAAQAKNSSLPAPGFPEIKELPDFDWKATEQMKLRPFKPKYHLTMDSFTDTTALETLSPSEAIPMDKTYLDRINYRKAVLKDPKKRPECINIDPKSREAIYDAIAELYTYLFTHYLPKRYPKMFKIHHTEFEYGKEIMIENKVTGLLVPARSKGGDGRDLSAEKMLETLAIMVDEDFLLLLPETAITGEKPVSKQSPTKSKPSAKQAPTVRQRKPAQTPTATTGDAMKSISTKATALVSETNPNTTTTENTEPSTPSLLTPYILSAYSSLYSNGFSPAEKLGNPLRQIHAPVPGYEEKLAGSMDKFFSNIEVGKYVKRANWSITTGGIELFAAPIEGQKSKTHNYEGDEVEVLKEIDPKDTYVRCERQTLYRLPHSKALVFAFHTYIYPIEEIKQEPDSAAALIDAIDGLKKGNVPQMHFYKRAVVWGDAVQKYLRS